MKKLLLVLLGAILFSSLALAAFNPGQNLSITDIGVSIAGKSQSINHDNTTLTQVANPLDEVRISVGAENKFTSSSEIGINDVQVEVVLLGISKNGDDIDLTSESVYLDYQGNNQQHSFLLNFTIPADAIEGTYEMDIITTGTDEVNNNYEIIATTYLTVQRPSHNLVIESVKLNPSALSCVSNTILNFDIVNAGREDEPYARYIITEPTKNSINIDKTGLSLSSDPLDSTNVYHANVPINVGNLPPGKYPIVISAYFDLSDLIDTTSVPLIVAPCVQSTNTSVQTPVVVQPAVQPAQQHNQTQNQQTTQKQTQQPATTQLINSNSQTPLSEPVVQGTPTLSSFTQSDAYIWLLVLAIIILLALILLIVINFVKRKE